MAISSQAWKRALPLVVSAACLAWVFSRFDVRGVIDSLSWNIAFALLPALFLYGGATLLIESASILRLIDRRPPDFGAWTAARVKSASYLLGIVNYALGGAALTVLLRRRAALGLGESAGIVLLISVTDLCVVLTLGTLGVLAHADRLAIDFGLVSVAGVGFFGGVILLRTQANLGPLERIRSLAVFDALRRTPSKNLWQIAGLRLIFSFCFIAVAGAAFVGFGVPVGLAQLVGGVMILALIGALPIAVAGIGPGQIAAVEVFRGVAPPETLLALSLVLAGGLIALRAGMGLLFAREFTREALEQTRGTQA
ncbi:MAG: lysylphosphatidylglycerol synthase domain-containing protein [Myxococcota bacterium]|nr:lysylphosphatidylglycerol synthase domain-containing protein [Myxococcota bacterium]